VTRRLLLPLLAALGVLAGCGGEQAGDGHASLWVTRNRGEDVVLTASVPAGLSAMEALRREAKIETRYGGRFVASIEGIDGDLAAQRDWFYFVNGYDADVSAAEYRLHDGDIVWFDYRSWARQMRVPVAVGAFPEPFVHGWGGHRRPAVVVGPRNRLTRRLAQIVHGRVGARAAGSNVLALTTGSRFRGELSGGPGDPVRFSIGRQLAERLVRDPSLARFRYAIP